MERASQPRTAAPHSQALAPGVRRCFTMDMLSGGRRDGHLVRCEPAVEATGQHTGLVFIRKHPRFHPAP